MLIIRLFNYLVLGPCIGLLLFVASISGNIPLSALYNKDFMLGAYLLGIVPALISLLSVQFLQSRGFSYSRILAMTPVVGAISVLLPVLITHLLLRAISNNWKMYGPIAILGLLTCLICEVLTAVIARLARKSDGEKHEM